MKCLLFMDDVALLAAAERAWTVHRDSELARLGRMFGASIDTFLGSGLEAPIITTGYVLPIQADGVPGGFLFSDPHLVSLALAPELDLILMPQVYQDLVRDVGPAGFKPKPKPEPKPEPTPGATKPAILRLVVD